MNISIVIPTKDRDNDLIECIQSISNQTILPNEIIVVDDGIILEITKEKISKTLKNENIDFIYLKKVNPAPPNPEIWAQKNLQEI